MKEIKSFSELSFEDDTFTDINVSDNTRVETQVVSKNKKDRRGFNKPKYDPKNSSRTAGAPKRKGRVLKLTRGEDSWKFEIGKDVFYTSTHFGILKNAKDAFDLNCTAKTWKWSTIMKIEDRTVLVPDREKSVSFLDFPPPKGGSSSLVGVEPTDNSKTKIVEGPTYIETLKDGSSQEGMIIAHDGPIYATFKLTGPSIEDNKTVIISIETSGYVKRIK